MAEIAEVVPVSIFLKLFGLPLERQAEYRALAKAHIAGIDFADGGSQRKLRKVADVMHDTIIARRDDPRDDLISLLWQTEFYGKPATLNDLENYCVMLFSAGLDTVVNGMGIGMPPLDQVGALRRRQRRRDEGFPQQKAQSRPRALPFQSRGMGADIGAQCVHMIDLPPEQCVGQQEVADFGPFQIERQQGGLIRYVGVVKPRAVKPA